MPDRESAGAVDQKTVECESGAAANCREPVETSRDDFIFLRDREPGTGAREGSKCGIHIGLDARPVEIRLGAQQERSKLVVASDLSARRRSGFAHIVSVQGGVEV